MNVRLSLPLLAAFTVLIGCGTGCEAVQSALDIGNVEGEWKGDAMLHISNPEPYPVEITIIRQEGGELAGTTTYPSLNCSGELVYERRRGSAYLFIQTISEGSCNDARVTIQPSGRGRLEWSWSEMSLPDEQDYATASATLKR